VSIKITSAFGVVPSLGATNSQGVLPELVASAVNSSGVVLSVLVRLICCVVTQLVVPVVSRGSSSPRRASCARGSRSAIRAVMPVAPVVPVVPLAPAVHWDTFTTPKPAGKLRLNCGAC